MKWIVRWILALACLLTGSGLLADEAKTALPGDSLYRLAVPLTSHQGGPLDLHSLAGKPALITMFYGNCKLACPVTLHSVQSIVNALPADKRSRLTVLLISLDAKNDNAASLAMLAQEHQMAAIPYLLAVSDTDRNTRTLAAALGIRYRRLSNGEINHSTRLLVTNAQGQVQLSSENMAPAGDPAIHAALAQQLAH